MPNRKDLDPETLPESGKVSEVKSKLQVGADFEIANRMQDGEFQNHFDKNRQERCTVRQDIAVAKVVQTEEELKAQQDALRHLQGIRGLQEDDEEMAKEHQRRLLREARVEREDLVKTDAQKAREIQRRVLQEDREAILNGDRRAAKHAQRQLDREAEEERRRLMTQDARVAQLAQRDLDMDMYLEQQKNAALGAKTARKVQEQHDSTSARLLTDVRREEELSGNCPANITALAESLQGIELPPEYEEDEADREEAQKMQDEEVARFLQQREIARYKAAKHARKAQTLPAGMDSRSVSSHSYQELPGRQQQAVFMPEDRGGRSPAYQRSVSENTAGSRGPTSRHVVERSRVVRREQNGQIVEERDQEFEYRDGTGSRHRTQQSRRMQYDDDEYLEPLPRPLPQSSRAANILSSVPAEPPPLPPREELPSLKGKKDKKKK